MASGRAGPDDQPTSCKEPRLSLQSTRLDTTSKMKEPKSTTSSGLWVQRGLEGKSRLPAVIIAVIIMPAIIMPAMSCSNHRQQPQHSLDASNLSASTRTLARTPFLRRELRTPGIASKRR
jgi:hypothetical protein